MLSHTTYDCGALSLKPPTTLTNPHFVNLAILLGCRLASLVGSMGEKGVPS